MTQTPRPADPAHASKRLWQIETALGAADMDRAIDLAHKAVREGVAHPLLHNLIAHRLEQQGRYEEAVTALRRGLKIDPNSLELQAVLGFSLIQLEQRVEALDVFDRLVRQSPTYAPGHYGRGSALERLGELDAARAEYERAVTLLPDYADAWGGLADLAERRREHAQAKAYAQRAMAIDPGHLDARLTLARIDTAAREFKSAQTRIEAVLADPRLKPVARGNARVLLGDAFDGEGKLDQAWAAYSEGKAELRRAYAPIFEAPGATSPTDAARRLAAEFAQTDPGAWKVESDAAARGDVKSHVFLFGFARSGTTLLEQVLATHPDVVALEERPTLHDTEMDFASLAGGMQRFAALDGVALQPYREAYWRRVRGFGVEPAGRVFIDKFPLNTFKIPLMAKLFPDARMLFALRDPRDVVLSCFRRSFRMNASMYQFVTLESTARYYDAVMAAAVLYRERLPLKLHEVRYEALVADFEGQARAVCAFLDLPWTEDLKNFADNAGRRAIATPSAAQVARGLYSDGVGQWRRYAEALAPVLPILKPWIERFGYPSD
jgi:tetratricopeptide (TPR) repeat protein